MKTLTTVTWIHEADLIASKLEAHGIRAVLPDERTVLVNPLYANAIGGLRILVDDAQLERARRVLDMPMPKVAEGDLKCPACGGDEIEYQPLCRRALFLSLLLVGLPLFWFRRTCRCKACGHRWKPA